MCTWSEPVLDEWIDYNGHLSEPYYVLVLGHATDAVMDTVGLGPEYRASTGSSLFTVEAHVRYLDQVGPGEQLEARSWVDRRDRQAAVDLARAVGRRARSARPRRSSACTSTRLRARSPFPDDVAARIEAALVPPGPDASRSIRVGR